MSTDGTDNSPNGGPGTGLASLSSLAREDEQAFADALVAEAEHRWECGSGATLEHFGAQLPAALTFPAARRALLMCEVSRRTHEPRQRVLDELLARHPALRDDIEAVVDMAWLMLSAEESAPAAESCELRPGAQFVNFRLCERLGSGSFGEVWRAWDFLLERYVALKILRSGPHDDDRAFLAEAQAAASIDHENVVRVHGAGTLFEGGPRYIDSQLVGDPAPSPQDPKAVRVGSPLDRAFASTRPRVREAAAIMRAVARGVAAAHARGVLHRDIKPSNILLTGSGRPMIADFGLSTIETAREESPRDGAPHDSRITGTPAYMSPEQARGERLTPQSDVYCLGATLRFLLTGRAPYEAGATHPRGSRWEIIRRVREASLAPLAGAPGIPADLCAICDRATAPAARDRYLSADALAEDLGAFLEHRPVSAAPVSALRRAALWYRRHAGVASVALGAIVAIALSSSLFVRSLRNERDRARAAETVAGEQRDEAVSARQEAVAQRDAAVTARRIAETINQFMADCIRVSDLQETDSPATMKDVLALIESRVHNSLKDDPLVRAGVMQSIAGMRDADRFVSSASNLLRECVAINTRVLGAESPQTLRSRQLYLSMYAKLGGVDKDECEREMREVLEIQRRTLGERHEDTLATLASLAALLPRERAKEAETMLRDVLSGYDETVSPQHPPRVQALRMLSGVCVAQGRIDEALGVEAQIVSLLRAGPGDRDPETMTRRVTYSFLLRSAGRHKESVAEGLAAARQIEWVHGAPTHDSARARIAAADSLLQALNDPEGAVEALEPLVWRAPGTEAWTESRAKALMIRGQAQLDMGLARDGLRSLRDAWELGTLRPLATPGVEARIMAQINRALRLLPRERITLAAPSDRR